VSTDQSLLLIFRDVWDWRREFYHLMPMGLRSIPLQLSSAPSAARRGTDNYFIDLLDGN